jgi:DNA-binding transcriptional MerR regulator/methylmalonyl-CoA mutase cobalamin-binding subunit
MSDANSRDARYPLRAVIRRTGLTADVIRAWERRYGAVSPGRSDGGQRLYSESDVMRLALLKKATSDGHSIGEIARLDASSLEALAARGRADSVRPDAGAASRVVIAEAIAAIESMDQNSLEGVLKRAVLSLGATRFIDSVAAELLTQVGNRWHAGTLAPFHEHLASDTVRRTLAWVSDAYEPERRAPCVVVATPAGELHELGAMIVAAAASEESWRVVYLGANLPAADIAAAARAVGANVVALSLVYSNGEGPTLEIRETARALPDGVALVVGGAAATLLGADRLGREVHVLDDIGSLRRLLRARREIRGAVSDANRG